LCSCISEVHISPFMCFRLVIWTTQAANAACSIPRVTCWLARNSNQVQTSVSWETETPDVSVSQGKFVVCCTVYTA
jgi:hypothetical protein